MGKILERKEKLEWARHELKKAFKGIDGPIDELIELTHSWYCFPEGQIRPTVINLVGMTGVGKTSLVQKLFELLGMENVLYQFDMGGYANGMENLKHEISKKVRSFDGSPICFMFDEFQLCRSIDSEGEEVDRSNFRPVWDLLDSGKINLIDPNHGIEILHLFATKLEHCVSNGLKSKGLEIISGAKYFTDLFGREAFDEDDDYSITRKPPVKAKPSMVPNGYFYYIQQCVPNRFVGDGELRNYLMSLRDEDSIINFLKETIEQGGKPKVYDFSSSIVFVIANIDEAFISSKEMDPDMDADTLQKSSMEIGIFDIKECLSLYFRSEQIARLGNNYIIYPAFGSNTYRDIIRLELRKKAEVIKERFNIDVTFGKSLCDIVYNEGVFPTQGTRPVFTTINYVVGSFVGRILSHLEESSMLERTTRIRWEFRDGKNVITAFEGEAEAPFDTMTYDVKIKVDNLRNTKLNDEQALTSVHEAGHAVVAAALLDTIPSKVISSSAGGSEGFNLINWKKLKSREYTINMAAMYLAGIEAEKLIFSLNEATIGGSNGDLSSATELITKMVQYSGSYSPWVDHANPNADRMDRILDSENKTGVNVKAILQMAQAKAVGALNKHRAALVALSIELFRHPVLDRKRVADIFAENGLRVSGEEVHKYKDVLLALEHNVSSKSE